MDLFALCSYLDEKQGNRLSSDINMFPLCFSSHLSLQIGALKDYYHFYHSRTIKRSVLSSRGTHSFISMEPKVRKNQLDGDQEGMLLHFSLVIT